MSSRPGQFPVSTPAEASMLASARPDALQVGAGRLGTTLRLPSFVAAAVLLGTASHGVAVRSMPAPWLVLAAAAAVALGGLLVRRRERTFETITGALLVSQVVVHVMLALGHPAAGPVTGGAHLHGASDPGTAALAHLVPDAPMLLAHLLAAGVAGWWLRRGEAAVWAAAGWIWPALTMRPAALSPAPAGRTSVLPLDRGADVLRDRLTMSRRRPRRGPPVPAAA